jgi:predicted dehydrogenase
MGVKEESLALTPTAGNSVQMRKLKGVLIGCGAIAREHLAALAELDNVEVAGICDLSAARAEATAERFGIRKWYTSYQLLLDEARPDLVHITTPPSSHFSIANACLSAGLNVICEKPITVDYSDFSILRELATKSQCMLMENQQLRFHSSVLRIRDLISSGELGEVLDVQIFVAVNSAAGSPYADRNAPHFSLSLRGGMVGDFLPHIAYLMHIFTGSVTDLRTMWSKRVVDSPLPADEFRAIIKGERATGHVAFSGNAQPGGFWLSVVGTRMRAETNLFELPRITFRRFRSGEPALMSLVDGIIESRDGLTGTVASFWKKLAGVGSYDGLKEIMARSYRAVEMKDPQPISLEEIDEVARLVDCFTRPEFKL